MITGEPSAADTSVVPQVGQKPLWRVGQVAYQVGWAWGLVHVSVERGKPTQRMPGLPEMRTQWLQEHSSLSSACVHVLCPLFVVARGGGRRRTGTVT